MNALEIHKIQKQAATSKDNLSEWLSYEHDMPPIILVTWRSFKAMLTSTDLNKGFLKVDICSKSLTPAVTNAEGVVTD